MMKKIAKKAVQLDGATFCGVCYAGVGEYVVPIMSEDLLLGAITAGFLSLSPQQTHPRIITAMGDAQQEDVDRAFRLYEQSITPMIAPQELQGFCLRTVCLLRIRWLSHISEGTFCPEFRGSTRKSFCSNHEEPQVSSYR